MNQLVLIIGDRAPALIAAVGERASYRFFEFFTANIRNSNTRRAYARAAVEFFDWLEARGVTHVTAVESVHVAAYIEQLAKARSAPTAKLRLAALRHLFDWRFCRKFCVRARRATAGLSRLTPQERRTASLGAICLPLATAPFGSCA